MRTTFAIAIGLIAGFMPERSPCLANTSAIVAATFTGTATAGQNGARTGDAKRQASQLLSARKALSEADWETADGLIAQAEALHVQYGKLYFGDTPEKCRAELERLRPAPSKHSVAGPKRGDAPSDIPPANQLGRPARLPKPKPFEPLASARCNLSGRPSTSKRLDRRRLAGNSRSRPTVPADRRRPGGAAPILSTR